MHSFAHSNILIFSIFFIHTPEIGQSLLTGEFPGEALVQNMKGEKILIWPLKNGGSDGPRKDFVGNQWVFVFKTFPLLALIFKPRIARNSDESEILEK